ncbi:MAG: hypothetical protein V1922_01885 [bacterium]
MKKHLFIVFAVIALCYRCGVVQAATVGPVDGAMTFVSATVGEPTSGDTRRFSIYGYTSPNATVNIMSPIHGETKANGTGLYEFKYLFLTLFHEDLCIVAHDTEGRSTPPLCIPPPTAEANKRVGPVILPPSTSISAGSAYIGDTIALTGQTIPNVDVKLSLFTDESQKNKKLSLIPEAYAYTIPQMSLTSNEKGEYSIVLPTASSQFIRMFTRALFEGNSTPKGLTLVLDIFPVWMLLLKFFLNFFSLLKAHLIELIILSQLYFLLIYVLRRFFNPHNIRIHRSRELALIHGEMTIMPHELLLQEQTNLTLRQVAIIRIPSYYS